MKSRNYIVVTVCKNEEANLHKLADSIINNTIKPSLWVILNDGSTDNTYNILTDLENDNNWIKIIHGKESKRDLGFHYAEIVKIAISKAFDICEKEGISFEYIGLIDADMILSNNFFEKLIDKFEKYENLGVASGTAAYFNAEKIIIETGRDNLPIGGLRVWKRECYIETGGFPISYSPDSVSNVLAILQGWSTKKFEDIVGIQTRRTSSAEGLWKGYRTKGESDYYRDYHPLYALFKFVKYSSTHPFYIGIAYFQGYINGVVKIRKKIDIPEVRQYYRRKHIEIGRYYAGKFKFKF